MKYKEKIKRIINKSELFRKVYFLFRDYYLINLYIPTKVRLEACTLCQLKCFGCTFQKNNHKYLGGGYLKFGDFKKFVDHNKYIKEIELSNYGEIFLNPDLIQIMKYASDKNISLTATSGCNFNTVSDEQIHALVDYNFNRITLSIDGASQETYGIYRKNGNYNNVIENVKKLLEYKKEKESLFPELIWQYIIMEHNELDIINAKKTAKELGIPIWFKLTWDKDYIPKNKEILVNETDLKEFTRDSYETVHEDSYLSDICNEMIYKPQINWDGRLIGCCELQYCSYDVNVFSVGLKKALRSKKFRKAKKMLLTLHPKKEEYYEYACYECKRRKTREKYGKTINI